MTIIIKPMDGAEVRVNEDGSLIFLNWNIQNNKPFETRNDPIDVPLAICDWLRSRILAERPGLRGELEKAYRCIRGFYTFAKRDEKPDDAFLSYQSLMIGAAIRYVNEDSLDGSQYFVGKKVDVLHSVLKQ